MSDRIPYGRQSLDEDDVEAVVEVLRSDWLTQGPEVERFERFLADRCGAAHAVAFNSGTAALHAACAAARLGEGDEVLTSPLSFAASANCARYVGATVDFVDVDPVTLVSPADRFAERAGPATRGIVPVHYAGRPLDLRSLEPLRRRGVVVIEDAAHALGAIGPDGPVGNCATSDMACFSFHPVKAITTGEGGAVTTNDERLAERLRAFRHHGIVRPSARSVDREGSWFYEQEELGFNFRLTDIQCALGRSQLRKLEHFVERRNEIAGLYRELLSGSGVELQLGVEPPQRHAYHLVVVAIPRNVDRRRIFDGMRAAGIWVQLHYIPIYLHPYYRRLGFEPGACPEAEAAYQRIFSLPVFPGLSDDTLRRITSILVSLLEREAATVSVGADSGQEGFGDTVGAAPID